MIHLDIQVYPAIKVQSQVHGHEYYVDPKLKERSKIERSTYYYTRTKDDLDEEDDDEEGVEKVIYWIERLFLEQNVLLVLSIRIVIY